MTNESVEHEVCDCGCPATERNWRGEHQCRKCYFVTSYAYAEPRKGPGNVSDYDIEYWIKSQLRKAIEEMVSLVRADLVALADKWSPPQEDQTQDGDQP